MEVTKDTNHETQILPREKNTSTYIFTLTIHYLHHNPIAPFISSICLISIAISSTPTSSIDF
jgi:hypothetical protein